MSVLQRRPDVETVRIVRDMNAHDAMTVKVQETHATRQVVEYASADLKTTLRQLPTGSSLPLAMEPVGKRGNAWRVVGIHGRDE